MSRWFRDLNALSNVARELQRPWRAWKIEEIDPTQAANVAPVPIKTRISGLLRRLRGL